MTELQRKAGRGLLMAMVDVDPNHLDEFTQWYETEHLVDRQKFPGMLTARRYINMEGAPREFLARYDMTSPEVLNTAEYQKIITTPWTDWVRRYFPRPGIRYVHVELGPESAVEDAKNLRRTDIQGLVLIFAEINSAFQNEFQDWIEKVCLPEVAACEGVLSARYFKELGDKTGSFLLLYDLASDDVARSPQFKKLPAMDPAFCASPPRQFLYKEIDQSAK